VGDDDAIFGINSLGSVRREAYNTTKVKIIDILFLFANLQALKSEVPVVCLVTGCVSRCRDRRYFHSFELRVICEMQPIVPWSSFSDAVILVVS
jgi:hypothetical protein